MAQLIDKAALVVEIEKRKQRNHKKCTPEGSGAYYEDGFILDIINSINSLEVKEEDFEKEWKEYFKYRGDIATVNIKHLAKHFFELGMSVSNKTQKGE